MGPFEKDETIVGHLRERGAELFGSIPKTRFMSRPEAGSVAQGGIAKRRREQDVLAAGRRVWRLRGLNQLFQHRLFFDRVDELTRGNQVLRFDDAPGR